MEIKAMRMRGMAGHRVAGSSTGHSKNKILFS